MFMYKAVIAFLSLAAVLVAGLLLSSCSQLPVDPTLKQVTLLFTNDLESAYDPVEAWWRDDLEFIGGVPQLATLIDQRRAAAADANQPVFLFDAGDIFTGTLARRTRGAVAFELMNVMGYDAMAIGNHEFEYGWEVLAQQKQRADFPVLGANLFYRSSGQPYAQPSAVIEKGGITIGIIGLMGQDAGTALIPANIAGVDVQDPVQHLSKQVSALRNHVDVIVVLVHQGLTAPMQTNDEADPEVQRGNAENLQLAGAVPGIDVILAGHTDAGTREPLRHPETGTIVMQTYGQGQHLGEVVLTLDAQRKGVIRADGRLLAVNSSALEAHAKVTSTLSRFRQQHPDITQIIGSSSAPLSRRYYHESELGSLLADIVRESVNAPIGLMPGGALRKDLPRGDIRRVDLLDVFPFEDRVATLTLSGAVLRQVIEQGLSLERGLLQISGLQISYDPEAPVGQRVRRIHHAGEPIQSDALYTVATLEILAQGGDKYTAFKAAENLEYSKQKFGDILQAWFTENPNVQPPIGPRYDTSEHSASLARPQ